MKKAATEFALIGDLHLDALLKYWTEANLLQIGTLRKVISACLQEGIQNIILLGDIAHGIRDSTNNTIRMSEGAQCAFLDLLCEFDGKCRIDIILGNHDIASTGLHSLQLFMLMQKLGFFKSIHFYEKATITRIEGVPVHFLPYPHTMPNPRATFAAAHYEVNGACSDSGHTLKANDHAYDTMVMQGHLHTRQSIRNHVYPGTMYQLNFGESLPKGYGVVRVIGRKCKYRWVEIDPPYKLVNLVVNSSADLKKLTASTYTLLKLFVSENVTIPQELLVCYPNIVNSLMFSDKNELESLQKAEFDAGAGIAAFDHATFLEPFMQAQKAPAWQMKRALQLLREAV